MRNQLGLRAALVQINTTVGDLEGNCARCAAAFASAREGGAQLVLFPELTLTGYPPEDLLLKPSFLEDTRASLDALLPELRGALAVVGFVDCVEGHRYNAAALIWDGVVRDVYHKCTLPNYGVFDEKRYFRTATRCPVYRSGPWRIALNICEDIWVPEGVAQAQRAAGANLILNLSASPYHAGKGRLREHLVSRLARSLGLPVLHTNLVGGQDELVFDGRSLAAASDGRLLARARQFGEEILLVDLPAPVEPPGGDALGGDAPAEPTPRAAATPAEQVEQTTPGIELPPMATALRAVQVDLSADWMRAAPPLPPDAAGSSSQPDFARTAGRMAPELDREEEIYRALQLGLGDYIGKNGFAGVVIGLSGGIDSALTAVIAADALGPAAVVGISMPTAYTSESARAGARALAQALGIRFHEISIQPVFTQLLVELQPLLEDRPPDVTEENIQARIRGLILMAYSNKFGHLVLATGNKSELAVGYCTLYGDMVGGFALLKDLFKTQVYRLARWRNAAAGGRPPIPTDTLERPPSAELRPDQRDTDALPPYETLDPIVQGLVEEEHHPRELVASGFPRALVDRIFGLIQANEYKRRQAPPGVKITPRAFGKDRRYPLTNRYRPRKDPSGV
ncbi:MAG: NAD+ synthase [Candidatus Eisenbacteria bacterium]|nr:NAD+ synthase [Candidatus Eisenbacteria bacterium]